MVMVKLTYHNFQHDRELTDSIIIKMFLFRRKRSDKQQKGTVFVLVKCNLEPLEQRAHIQLLGTGINPNLGPFDACAFNPPPFWFSGLQRRPQKKKKNSLLQDT